MSRNRASRHHMVSVDIETCAAQIVITDSKGNATRYTWPAATAAEAKKLSQQIRESLTQGKNSSRV